MTVGFGGGPSLYNVLSISSFQCDLLVVSFLVDVKTELMHIVVERKGNLICMTGYSECSKMPTIQGFLYAPLNKGEIYLMNVNRTDGSIYLCTLKSWTLYVLKAFVLCDGVVSVVRQEVLSVGDGERNLRYNVIILQSYVTCF